MVLRYRAPNFIHPPPPRIGQNHSVSVCRANADLLPFIGKFQQSVQRFIHMPDGGTLLTVGPFANQCILQLRTAVHDIWDHGPSGRIV